MLKTYFIFRKSDNQKIGKIYAVSRKEAEEKKNKKYGRHSVFMSGKGVDEAWANDEEDWYDEE